MRDGDVIVKLAETIRARRAADGGGSYTRQLLDKGPVYCARKFGEEAVELVLAAAVEDGRALTNEAADVIYHLLVVLESRGVAIGDVLAALEARMAQSGLAEKAARAEKAPG